MNYALDATVRMESALRSTSTVDCDEAAVMTACSVYSALILLASEMLKGNPFTITSNAVRSAVPAGSSSVSVRYYVLS